MAATTCPHGFAPGSCLICQTLSLPASRPGAASPERPQVEVLTDRRPRRRGAGLGVRATGVAVVLVVAALAVWWVAAAVWALLRIVELVAVAVVFGYSGWKLGVRHGRHHPRT